MEERSVDAEGLTASLFPLKKVFVTFTLLFRNCMENIERMVYSKSVVEFVAVASEFCHLVENPGSYSLQALADLSRKLLPLLYFKASLLPNEEYISDDPLEKFVTELDYNVYRARWEDIFGEYDTFHEVFDPEIQFGTETVTATISENILDIYQDLKDFITSYSLGNEDVMHDALLECRDHFAEFWGQRLVNVLRALHQLVFSGDLEKEEGEKPGRSKSPGKKPGWEDPFISNGYE